MNIAICDDEFIFRNYLEDQLKVYYGERSIPLNILHFDSGEALIHSTFLFDLVFLDVEMQQLNGIETGKILKKNNPHCIILVITSHNGYLDDAFKINAFRFLSKPLDVIRLYKSLDDAAELIHKEMIVFYDIPSKENIRIYANEIIYLEISKKKTKVVTVNGEYFSREKMNYWKNKLNSPSFVCPHSSYIVNLDYSIRHSRTKLLLAKKDVEGSIMQTYCINIAPSRQSEIKDAFFYILERR